MRFWAQTAALPGVLRGRGMSATCLRLKQLLLSRWLAAPPALPTLRLSSDATSITAAFQYTPPTLYNAGDVFELQARASVRRKRLALLADARRLLPCRLSRSFSRPSRS
jgi:hypothetical protein